MVNPALDRARAGRDNALAAFRDSGGTAILQLDEDFSRGETKAGD